MVADEARVQLLATLLDRIDCLIFPEPHDPWPRHGEHSGASIAVTVDAYRRVGGMPALPIGEDRAFFEAMRRVDARIRHAPDVFVTVSGRLFGRAKGGMAETMRRRMRQPDAWLDDPIEPAGDRLRRARTRRQLHAAWRSGMPDAAVVTLSASLGLAPRCLRDLVDVTYFGEAWHRVVSASEPLRRRHVAAEARELEIALACDVLATLENTPAEMVGSTDGMSSRAAMTGGG